MNRYSLTNRFFYLTTPIGNDKIIFIEYHECGSQPSKFDEFLVEVVNRSVVNSIHEWKAGHFFHISEYSDGVPSTIVISQEKIRHLRRHLMRYSILAHTASRIYRQQTKRVYFARSRDTGHPCSM